MVIEKIKPVNAVAKKIPPKIDEIPIRRKFYKNLFLLLKINKLIK